MKKTLVLNLENIKIKGNILDVVCEDLEVIHNLSEDIQEEMAIDNFENRDIKILEKNKYDVCTFFFNLNSFWNINKKENLINEMSDYIKESGEVYIWDINKNIGELIDVKLKCILPNKEIKEYKIKNNNIFSSSNFEETKKILEKTFKIEETKVWEDIYFIKGIKK